MNRKLSNDAAHQLDFRVILTELNLFNKTQLAKGFGVSSSTFYRYINEKYRDSTNIASRTRVLTVHNQFCHHCEAVVLTHPKCKHCEVLIHEGDICPSCIDWERRVTMRHVQKQSANR